MGAAEGTAEEGAQEEARRKGIPQESPQERDIQILLLSDLVELGNLLPVIGFLVCNFEQKRLVERRRLWPEARDEIWSMRLKSAFIIVFSVQSGGLGFVGWTL